MIARSLCLYGVSDAGKTAQLGRFARYVYEKTGKITRLVGADNGGWAPLQSYIDLGIIEAWSLLPLAVSGQSIHAAVHLLARGHWPGVVRGKNGDELKMLPANGETFKRVGAYAIDSGTGLAELIHGELRAKGPKIAQEASYQYSAVFDGVTVTQHGSNKPYIGFVQDSIRTLITNFSALPVERVCWTFGEATGEDEVRKSVYGPDVIGRALTGKMPKDFGDLLHFEFYSAVASATPDPVTGKANPATPRRRIYWMTHADPFTGVNYPAKPRIELTMWPELARKWPNGYLEPQVAPDGTVRDGLDAFLMAEDDLATKASTANAQWKERTDRERAKPVGVPA